MSLFYDNDNYELSTNIELNSLLAELPFELIKQNIIDQINDPVSTHVNYIDVIIDKCSAFKELHSEDEDLIRELNDKINDFFIFIITKIDNKFDLGLDINSIASSTEIVTVGVVLYEYFILRYIKNISKFITKFIIKNKKSIAENYSDVTKKDVSTLAFKKQIKNKDDLTIITNLPSIIKYIFNLEIEPEYFIDFSAGADNYEASVIKSLIANGKLVGNFVREYMSLSINDHDYILDEIQTDIKIRIMKNIKK